jgi:azurin
MATVQDVLDCAIHDLTFREQVLQDAAHALAPFGLSPADQDRVLQHVELLSSGEEEEVALDADTHPTDTGPPA